MEKSNMLAKQARINGLRYQTTAIFELALKFIISKLIA